MITKKLFTLTAALAGPAMGASLNIDFQPTGGTTAAGFQAFEHTTNTDFATNPGTSYSEFGSSILVVVSASGVENVPADHRSIQRNGSLTDVRNDWLGVDGRNATNPGQTSFFTITISGLPAGSYTWTSSHHDGGTGASGPGQGNIFGTVSTSFTDANGTVNGTGSISAENPAGGGGPQPESFFTTPFTSDGSPVSLTMGTTGINGDAIFALTNNLVIADAVPEPSTALLGLLGGLGLLRRRR